MVLAIESRFAHLHVCNANTNTVHEEEKETAAHRKRNANVISKVISILGVRRHINWVNPLHPFNGAFSFQCVFIRPIEINTPIPLQICWPW